MEKRLSILYPPEVEANEYYVMSEVSWHDLGMDMITRELSNQDRDLLVIKNVMKNLTKNPRVSLFRGDVFDDITGHPDLLENVIRILKEVEQLQEFMSRKNNISNTDGVWTLSRRLKEVHEYILCIEELHACLAKVDLKSEGLTNLRDEIDRIRKDCEFASLKKDIEDLRLETKKIKSVTLGVNLSEYMDAKSVGIISINEKAFTKPGLLTNFTQRIFKQDQIQKDNAWKDNYNYQPVSEDSKGTINTSSLGAKALITAANPLMGLAVAGGMAGVAEDSKEVNLMEYLNEVANSLLASSVKRLKEVLSRYATVDVSKITALIPEFTYYILWAEYLNKLKKEGYHFHKASLLGAGPDSLPANVRMQAKNVYNLKLATFSKTAVSDIVGNDLCFDEDHNLYILTGANRGGKTTITQAIGQLYVLAQGGIYIPGDDFIFEPVDRIFTHFPADEDKTMDFGRLGEECNRFREIYEESTKDSLMLLNESFSTTSFEEGYYIAFDAIRALLYKGTRTIYNTHMHKLARDIEMMNESADTYKAASLIVASEEGRRSYKVIVAPAEGVSLANDIALKYGVTFDLLTGMK